MSKGKIGWGFIAAFATIFVFFMVTGEEFGAGAAFTALLISIGVRFRG